MTGWIRHILSTEQKKTDFRPEDESAPLQMYSKVQRNWNIGVSVHLLRAPEFVLIVRSF